MKQLLFLFFMLCSVFSDAQHLAPFFRGAGTLGTGNQVSTFTGIQASYGNPAGLVSLEALSVYFGAENRFEIPELMAYQAAFAIPVDHWGIFGLNVTDFGGNLYRDQKIGLIYARKLHKNFSIGAQFDWLIMKIDGYGHKHRITLDVGLQSQLTDQLSLGFHIFSPYPLAFDEDRIVPAMLTLGMDYRISSQVLIKLEVQKNSYEIPSLHAGIRYQLLQAFMLSLGMRTETRNAIMTSGIGYRLPIGMEIDFGMNYHQSLGISSAIGFSYTFKKRREGVEMNVKTGP